MQMYRQIGTRQTQHSDAFIQNKPTIPSGSGSGFNLRGAWVSGEAIAANDIVYVGDGNSRAYWLAMAPIIGYSTHKRLLKQAHSGHN